MLQLSCFFVYARDFFCDNAVLMMKISLWWSPQHCVSTVESQSYLADAGTKHSAKTESGETWWTLEWKWLNPCNEKVSAARLFMFVTLAKRLVFVPFSACGLIGCRLSSLFRKLTEIAKGNGKWAISNRQWCPLSTKPTLLGLGKDHVLAYLILSQQTQMEIDPMSIMWVCCHEMYRFKS